MASLPYMVSYLKKVYSVYSVYTDYEGFIWEKMIFFYFQKKEF